MIEEEPCRMSDVNGMRTDLRLSTDAILPVTLGTVLCLIFCQVNTLCAGTFRHITAEPGAGAQIEDTGNLMEKRVAYRAIYKPVPQADWCKKPWIDTTESFRGKCSIGMEIMRKETPEKDDVDKVNLTITTGRDSFALAFGNTRYTGFAVKLPSKGFEIPENGKGLMIAQWWQGSPYGPPLRLAITSETSDIVSFKFHVMNDDTLGNPSAKSLEIGGGQFPFDTWTKFVVLTTPDFTGQKGEVRVWINDKEQFRWNGKLGYNPSGKPYKNATVDTLHPNPKFDVFYGPYRQRQNRQHQMFFDEIKFADSYKDAAP